MSKEKNEKKKKFNLADKIKNVNFKKFARGFALVWMIVFIVVMTITNVGIDKDFNWIKWLGSAMILFGIAVFGLFIGESIGVDFSKEKIEYDDSENVIGGLYQKNLYEYNVFRKAIDDIIIYFPLFYDWIIPQELESKQVTYLMMNDISKTRAHDIVKYCDADDLWEMKKGAIKKTDENGKEVYIKKLAEHEIQPVEDVLKGHVKLELSGCSYYLQAFAESNQRYMMEQGEGYRQARRYNKKSSRAIRLVSGAFISLGIGILTVNDFVNASNGQAWMNLVTRIANLFTALFSGWISGTNDVKLEASAIENKRDVLKWFKSAYDKKLFPIYDEHEAAQKEFEEQEAKKQKEAQNVITPEVVEDVPEAKTKEEKTDEILAIGHQSDQIEMKGK